MGALDLSSSPLKNALVARLFGTAIVCGEVGTVEWGGILQRALIWRVS
jgi:hypothetical protein